MVRNACLFSVSAVAFLFSASAQAEKISESFSIKNQGANATFFGVDECAAVAVSVFYSDTVSRIDHVNQFLDPNTYVEVDYQDCNGASFFLSGVTNQQQASIRGDQGAATLYAAVPVSGTNRVTDEPVNTTITLNLSWTATGPGAPFKQKFNSNEGGVKFKYSQTSEARPAQATGVAVADLPIAGGDDRPLIFAPSLDGLIAKNVFGQVTVTKIK